ncbi:MAG: hypothetical protein M1826_004969 [Phylliscum demangeonii]|nr:MAG: hypothetical protein M1826_004969 [Phylliscum demangeonii]
MNVWLADQAQRHFRSTVNLAEGKIDAEQAKAEKAEFVEGLDDVGSESLHGIEGTVCVLQADERLAPELARVGQDRRCGGGARDVECVDDDESASDCAMEQALLAMARGVAELVVVLPTGGGKSLLFLLPCLLPGAHVTVVILPLVALRQDLMRRCEEVGVGHVVWSPSLDASAAPLALAAAEHTVQPAFRAFLIRLHQQRRLERIVMDEAHLVMTARDYRRCMATLGDLRQVAVPFVALTATLPPARLDEFGAFLFLAQPSVHVRDAIARIERMYDELKREQANHDWRVIVFTPYIDQCEQVAAALHTTAYHGSTDGDARELALAAWTTVAEPSRTRIVVGTSALGAGVDHPRVRLVVHVGAPTRAIAGPDDGRRELRECVSDEGYESASRAPRERESRHADGGGNVLHIPRKSSAEAIEGFRQDIVERIDQGVERVDDNPIFTPSRDREPAHLQFITGGNQR